MRKDADDVTRDRRGYRSARGSRGPHWKRMRRTLVCAVVLIAAGCATMRAYPGPERTPAEVAVVRDYFRFWGVAARHIEVQSIDGEKKPALHHSAEVLPGHHTIVLHAFDDTLGLVTYGPSPCSITFEAQPGRTYQVGGEIGWNEWRAWLVDQETNETIPCQFESPAAAGNDRAGR